MQKGKTFTRIILSLNKLGAKGEAVKEKIEKRRTRALRVRVGAEVGGRFTFEKEFPVVSRVLQV